MKRLLLLEDDLIMGESLQQRFELEGFRVCWLMRLAELPQHLGEPWDAVVSDVRLPDGRSTDWFVQLPEAQRAVPWFFLTGYGSVDDAVRAIQAGARDYLTKPFDVERLVGMVNALRAPHPLDSQPVLGVSAAMQRIEAQLVRLARQPSAVLICGESGVGKEVVAQRLHALDERPHKGEFVAVNCAAVPETMMEAEFFGHERGAFTGAARAHRGFLERAHQGTLFLDEVGELPLHMQAKLLRALQEKSFFRLGSEKLTRSDFRIVSATNRDLHALARDGRFREDLFYRLAVIRLDVPPLRERPEDIRWLADLFLRDLATQLGTRLRVSEAFLAQLLARPWPGNARELRNHLEQQVVMSEDGVLEPEPLAWGTPLATGEGNALVPLQQVVQQAERAHIRRVLDQCGGSIGRSAEMLGISRKTLWEKMRRLGVEAQADS